MQIGWAGEFFVPGKYFEGDKILIALAVLLGFNVLYLAAGRVGEASRPDEQMAFRLHHSGWPPSRWSSPPGS